ncbi:hypothetical protein ATERTT37_007806 [Aspergillus terreus]
MPGNTVAGYDFSGTVIATGAERAGQFQAGDRVMGFAAPALDKPKQYGAHQDVHCARHFVYHVPAAMPIEEAACFMVVTHTAADALFNQLQLSLDASGDDNPEPQPLLVWGGASAVGTAAIQLAAKAGCTPILTTASPRNNAALRQLGATECFDYADPDVVSKICAALAKYTSRPLARVLDAVVARNPPPSSTTLCEACVDPTTENALFTSPVPATKEATRPWTRTFACRNVAVDFTLRDGTVLRHAPDQQMQDRIDRATRWAIAAYGTEYRMPNVAVVQGGEAGIRAMRDAVAGKASMQKFVIQHPI